MRFSLKDFLWSVTLAFGGLACLGISVHKFRFREYSELNAALLLLCGGLLGAALGRLVGNAVEKIVAGLVLGLLWWLLFSAAN